MNNGFYARTLLICLLLGALPGRGQSPASCSALVGRSDDLYLVDPNGNSVARFTSDGQPKESPSISPDGSMVAFMTADAMDTVQVADRTGKTKSFVPPPIDIGGPTNAALIQVYWQSNDILVAVFHVSPDTSEFDFYSIPRGLSGEMKMLGQSWGASCALLSGGSHGACAGEGTVSVNDKFEDKLVYDDAFAGARKVSSARIAMGASASLGKGPNFRVAVQSLSEGITLRITPEDGHWVEPRVTPNDYFDFQASEVLFGFVPTIADASRGIVRVDLYQSRLDPSVIDLASAVRERDNTFAMIEREPGKASIVVLAPPSQGSTDKWTEVGRAPLSVPDAVTHWWFADDSTLGFETEETFGQIPIRIVTESGKKGVRIGDITMLPKVISYSNGGTSVEETSYGWSCH